MVSPLDEVRDRIGLRPASQAPAARSRAWTQSAVTPIRLADVARAGRYPAEELSRRTRWFVGGAAAAAAVVGITHGLLASGLADASSGPWSVARAVVGWPSPVSQQVLSAIAAVALFVIALATDGYRHVSRRLSWSLLAATFAAVLGAAPMILVCAATAVVWALIILLVVAAIVAIIAILMMAA